MPMTSVANPIQTHAAFEATPPQFELVADPHGRWILTLPDGSRHEDVHAVRAHPLSDPDGAASITGADGHEVLWIPDARRLTPEANDQLLAALAERSFMPEIQAIEAVSSFTTPSHWTVRTDRGVTRLVLNGEEDIRRLPDGRLLVTDAHGVAHVIARPAALDRTSRRLLERFL